MRELASMVSVVGCGGMDARFLLYFYAVSLQCRQ